MRTLLFSSPVPSDEPFSMNVTVPVPWPPLARVTVAVNVTDWPNADGPLLDEVTVTVVVLATRSISLLAVLR